MNEGKAQNLNCSTFFSPVIILFPLLNQHSQYKSSRAATVRSAYLQLNDFSYIQNIINDNKVSKKLLVGRIFHLQKICSDELYLNSLKSLENIQLLKWIDK